MSSPIESQSNVHNTDNNQEVFQIEKSVSNQYNNDHIYINEQTDDDKKFQSSVADRQDAFSLENQFELDEQNKCDFNRSEEHSQFIELIVVSQFRKDRYINEQDPQLFFLLEKAIYKGVRNLLMKANKINDKEQWMKDHYRLIKVFYQDINVGYITSTGQIKSTAFIYIHNSILENIHNKSIHINFKKNEMKIIAFYFSMDYKQTVSELSSPLQFQSFQRQFTDQPYESPTQNQIGNSEIFKNALTEKNEETQNEIQKKLLPICHQSNWLKQAFIKKDYFKNQFLVLQKTNEEELKLGITIYFVYKINDDQIYAVKKSRLSSQCLSFYDVFSTVTITDMTADQRKIREAKILSKLNHPNILTLYDWWIEEELNGYSLFMQTEYCSFPGLKHQTNDLLNYAYYYLNPMPAKEKLECMKSIMLQIMDGLEYIHKRGIVHRDLKPENIFVTQTIHGELQVMLADFDQGKDVRESKLSIITDEKIPELELNSIKSKNTIKSGTSGYTTANSQINKEYDKMDEFYALGVTLLHLVLAFPGEPNNRNLYASTFAMSEVESVLMLFDSWANKLVKNKNSDFQFRSFLPQLELAKKLLDKKVKEHDHIRAKILSW